MKKKSWKEIINSKVKYIYLFGYGSLLNKSTHHNNHNKLIQVKAKGYKRSFSLSYSKEKTENEKYKERFKITAKQIREDYTKKENILKYIENSGSLTVKIEEGKEINGLLLKIEKEDFKSYAEREKSYKLQEIKVEYCNEKEKLKNEKIYILIAENEKLKKTNIYYLYQKNCRIGAYKQSIKFGKKYDETTYSYNGELAYKELNQKIFKKGRKFKLNQNLITINLFPGEKENIIKNDGEICTIIDNNKYLAKIMIDKTGEIIWVDNADLSII